MKIKEMNFKMKTESLNAKLGIVHHFFECRPRHVECIEVEDLKSLIMCLNECIEDLSQIKEEIKINNEEENEGYEED